MTPQLYRWTQPHCSETGLALIKSCLDSGQWSYGPVARSVERHIAHHTNTEAALLVNSGTSALWLLLALARSNKKQSIILPAFGYSAAAAMAMNLGYDIYLADSTKEAPVVDPSSVKRLIDDTVAVIIGINYFGYSVAWNQMPQSKKYKLIEDAAGSFGAQYKESPSGSLADAAIFSFHTSKALAAGGEGGAIVSDAATIKKAYALARNGHSSGYYYAESIGMNMTMTDIAASILKDTLSQFEKQKKLRQKSAEKIQDILLQVGLTPATFNFNSNHREQNYQTIAITVRNRNKVLELMRLNGIEARPCWPHLVSQQPAFNPAIKRIDGDLKYATHHAQHILNIPVHPQPTAHQLDRLRTTLEQLKEHGLLEQAEELHD